MVQKATKAKISGEKFYGMEMTEVLNAINLEPRGGYRTYKGKIYLGGASGLRYGEEVAAFQVLYNRMIEDGIITGKKIKEDGKYWDESAAAVRNLQKQINEKTGMGILVDGYFGIETWSGTYALLTGDTAMLEKVMKQPVKGEVPKKVTRPERPEEEKEEEKKTLDDFYKAVKKITKKSSPNEKFEWNSAYSEELAEIGIVEKDDYGNYQLTEGAKKYLEEYNKGQKKDWKVTESSLEEAINDPSKFKNKHAKAIEYIMNKIFGKYEEEAGGGLPGVGEGRGEEVAPPTYEEKLIPDKVYDKLTREEKGKVDSIADIIAKENDEEAKRKMLAALEALKESENPEEILRYWLAQKDLRKTLITAGSELAG